MQEKTVDLRTLIKSIAEKKELNANLSLEFDCTLQTTDHIPLVKVINYIMNFLSPLSENKMEISLNAAEESYIMSFIVATEKSDIEPINEQVKTVLADYHGTLTLVHEPGKYVQLQIKFE